MTPAVVLGTGVVTGVLASNIQYGLPTPGMGLFERVNAYGYVLGLAVFAVVLLRAEVRARRFDEAAR